METVQVTPLSTLASCPQSECTRCCQQGHPGSKMFIQQTNEQLLNGDAGLTQVDRYNSWPQNGCVCVC